MRLRQLAVSILLLSCVASAPAFADQTQQAKEIIWRDPGDVAALDLRSGLWGQDLAPQPPFVFIKEEMSGTAPKVKIKDGKGTEWVIKFGIEAKPSAFSARMVAAMGYIVEPNFLVLKGRVEGVKGLNRAAGYFKDDGRFEYGRFELRGGDMKYMDDSAWKWSDNPFLGTKELSGLKIMVMLLSDWDDKDAKDQRRGPNTSMFRFMHNGETVMGYSVDDWGRTMGRWGNFLEHTTWDCKGYTAQTPDFVSGVDKGGNLVFGYKGTRNEVKEGIRLEHAQWFMQYLGKLTDTQIAAALDSVGAKPEDVDCMGNHLRARIEALQQVITTARQSGAAR